jgi:bis(5'-nucleosyl)-tetraphosphatase (symmetrical)
VPGQTRRDIRIVCGHWSTLGFFAGLGVYAIDTGCVWGGALTALRLDVAEPEVVSIKSDRKPAPGKEQD